MPVFSAGNIKRWLAHESNGLQYMFNIPLQLPICSILCTYIHTPDTTRSILSRVNFKPTAFNLASHGGLCRGRAFPVFIAVRGFRMPCCSSSAHDTLTDHAVPSNNGGALRSAYIPIFQTPLFSSSVRQRIYLACAHSCLCAFSLHPRRPVLCVFLAGCRILLAEIFEAKSLLISDSIDTGLTLSLSALLRCTADPTSPLGFVLLDLPLTSANQSRKSYKTIRPRRSKQQQALRNTILICIPGLHIPLYITHSISTTTSLFSQR